MTNPYTRLIGVALLGLSLCMGATAQTTQPAPSVTVGIDNFNFTPKNLTVDVGTAVTWVNHDDVPHTATAKGDTPLFDSKALDTDEKFSFTFAKPGVYPYYCKVHPHMTGTITVVTPSSR
jgi:plastocyanin